MWDALVMGSAQDALRRIGGPNSVTWFAFWATLAANVLHHLGGAPDLTPDMGVRLLAVVVSQIAMFAVLLVARATILRRTAVTPRPWATLATFAFAGLVRGFALIVVWGQLVDLQTPQVAQRLITGMVSFAVYLAVSAYVVDLYRENERTLEQSEHTQATLAAARRQAQEVLATQGREGVDEVRAEIAAHWDTQKSGVLMPGHLEAFLDGALRPMIRQLVSGIQRWSAPPPTAVDTSLSVRRIYGAIGVEQPFAPAVQAGLSMAATIGIAAVLPWWRSVPALLCTFLGPWMLFIIGNRALRGLTPQMPSLFRAAAVGAWLLACSGLLGMVYGLILWGTPYVLSGVMSGVFVTILLAVTTVIARATLTAQRTSAAELQRSSAQLRWEIARLGQMQWHQQQQLARALHGPVQTAVIQTVMQPGHEDVAAFRERLLSALQDSLRDGTTYTTVSAVLEGVSRSWADICELRWQVDPSADSADGDQLALACLTELVQEAVRNAVRHGGARSVAITVAAEADSLRVTVVDNGATSATGNGTGMGTRMMDDCCLAWSRERAHDGTRLSFLLPALLRTNRSAAAPSLAAS